LGLYKRVLLLEAVVLIRFSLGDPPTAATKVMLREKIVGRGGRGKPATSI